MIFIAEFTKEVLDKMKKSWQQGQIYSTYYDMMVFHDKHDMRFERKSERIKSCLNFWEWDAYHENKKLDLIRLNRCKDRYCPNCRRVSLSQAIVNFKEPFKYLIEKGYEPYFLTLTSPNVTGDELSSEIKRLGKSFSKLWEWLYKPINIKDSKGFSGRLINATACIRTLEITTNPDDGTYNPHLHIMLFIEPCEDFQILKRYIPGPYRKISKSYMKFSDLEIQIMQLWYMAYNRFSIRNIITIPDTWYSVSGDWTGLYICNIEPMEMPTGIYEVFKYTYKDTDIENFEIFNTIYYALSGRRLRQGHGELYNLKLEFDEESKEKYDDIRDYLDKEETPEKLYTKTIQELITFYHDYQKISRFKGAQEMGNLD